MATLTNNIDFPEEFIDQIAQKVSSKIMNTIREQPQPNQNEIMGVPEVSSYLGMSPRWIYDRVNNKSIPHMKMGSTLKFSKKEIDKWLDTFRVPNVRPPSRTIPMK